MNGYFIQSMNGSSRQGILCGLIFVKALEIPVRAIVHALQRKIRHLTFSWARHDSVLDGIW